MSTAHRSSSSGQGEWLGRSLIGAHSKRGQVWPGPVCRVHRGVLFLDESSERAAMPSCRI
jgi:predicted ATPase with chaperone activity